MIGTILVANRGEIACRIIQSCRRLGIRSVAVYSDADEGARHVLLADEAIRIGPPLASESYLMIEAIIAAAKRSEADAVHPGYGFLAEKAEFARSCIAAGLIFIGPSPEVIETMGDKSAAKNLAIREGVPVIPGYHGRGQSDVTLRGEAKRLGFPILVKAADGGGGKGMRVVYKPAQLLEALAGARREAMQAFGSDRLILERPLSRPRHIEFQILGDQQGNIIQLGERECSIQRRYQKVIEESPAPGLTVALRARMGAAAAAVAKAIRYSSAGTVEFLLDEEGQFYFLEMNTRLQVEHPVTEMVTGIDLVEWQIRIADGESLPVSQVEVETTGHAIEARLYAEDPAKDFLPQAGQILLWREPDGDGIRVDSGIQSPANISLYYDPMLAKVIAYGDDRRMAIRRLRRALSSCTLLGVNSNLRLLRELLHHQAFLDGKLNTAFLDQHFSDWQPPKMDESVALMAASLAHPEDQTPMSGSGFWRNNPNRPQLKRFRLNSAEEPVEVELLPLPQKGSFQITVLGHTHTVQLDHQHGADLTLTVDGYRQTATLASAGGVWWVDTRNGLVVLHEVSPLPEPKAWAGAGSSLRAPMPGSILDVLVEVGQQVCKGQALLKLEAMKMEHTIRAAADGVVEAIYFSTGDTVDADAQLLQIGR